MFDMFSQRQIGKKDKQILEISPQADKQEGNDRLKYFRKGRQVKRGSES